ncbi:hypothetical protein BC834DRAFT_970437 [Gloeopeniophorella convolvens]|nr:hypothetical protein BC834DRAFT_970437 [Gloeopeniophorella convolvens]
MNALIARQSAQTIRSTALRRSAQRAWARSAHTESKAYSGIPFKTDNKRALAVKFILFWGGGMALPFAASWWQLRKGINSSSYPIRSPVTRAEACVAFHKEAEGLKIRLRSVYSQINAHLPISLLPPELLSRIFRHLRDDVRSVARSQRLGWATVTHVCQQWRRVALEDASLWGKISGVWLKQQWLPEVLARSKQAPIDITHHAQPSHAVFSMLTQLFPRVRTLSLLYIERINSDLQGILRSEAPSLEELTLERMESTFISLMEKKVPLDRFALFDGQAPKLRKIHLDLFRIPWICYSNLNLRHLEVHLGLGQSSGDLGSLGELVEALFESGRVLEVLILDGCLDFRMPPPHPPRTIGLPHLHSLHLRGPTSCVMHLFNLLDMPSLVELNLYFKAKDRAEVAGWPAIVPTVLSRYERADFAFRRLHLDLATFPKPTTLYASCPVPLPSQGHSLIADRVSLMVAFDDMMKGRGNWRYSIMQKACAAQSMAKLNLVKIRAVPPSFDVNAPTSGFDVKQWALLFRPYFEVTKLEVHGQNTDLLLRAMVCKFTRSDVTGVMEEQTGPHAPSQEDRDTVHVQPLLFPRLTSLSLNGVDLTETDATGSLILSNLVDSLTKFRERLGAPIKELRIRECTIPAGDVAVLESLVPTFLRDGCENLSDSEDEEGSSGSD